MGLGGLRIGPVGLPVNLREGDVLLAKKKFNLQNAGRKQLSGGPVRDFFSFHFTDATQIIGGEITISGRTVFIFNTHWHASPIVTEENNNKLEELLREDKINLNQYDKFLKEALEGQKWRLDESHKTIAFIDEVAGDSPVILLGDFNALAGSDEIKVLTDSGFKDVYGLAGSLPGYTWDGFVNYNIQKQMQMHPQDFLMEPSQKRIDYIFIRGPCLKILSSQVILDGPVNGLFTSDHFGIIAEIELE